MLQEGILMRMTSLTFTPTLFLEAQDDWAGWQPSAVTGTSVQGRLLRAWERMRLEPKTAPLLMIVAATHGDEPESHWLAHHWMMTWEAQGTGSAANVVVVPALNPDGLVANTRQNAKGVDLNRNLITTNWGQATDIAEKELGHPYYGGPAPGSEPETQWLMQLMAHYCPQGILSLHTPYAVVNWDGPVSSGGVSPAQQWAEALSAVTGYPVTDDIGYPTPGSLGTYAGVERHIPVITLELAEAFNQPNPSHALQGLWQTHQSVIQTSLAQPFLHAPIGQQQGLLA